MELTAAAEGEEDDCLDKVDLFGAREQSAFMPYGVGLALMFKFMKYMALVFFGLTLLSLPAFIVFYNADGLQDNVVSDAQALARLTVGNLGQGYTECSSQFEPAGADSGDTTGTAGTVSVSAGILDSTVHVGCPDGAQIGSIEAYFGDIAGHCGCPFEQTPAPRCTTTFPYLSESRRVHLPSGRSFFGDACCAAVQDGGGLPSFSDLDITFANISSDGVVHCASMNAQLIASRVCLGQESCTLTPQSGHVHSWKVKTAEDCNTENGLTLIDEGDGLFCGAAFNSTLLGEGSGLEDCTVEANKRLVVVATCYAQEVDLGWWGKSTKADISGTLAVLDVIGIVVFLYLVRNLAVWEKTEGTMKENMSASDFTVFLPSLPAHDDVDVLAADLKEFLEKHLSSTPPVPTTVGEAGQGQGPTERQPQQVRVVDINFGMAGSNLLQLHAERGKLVYELEAVEKLHLIRTEGTETFSALEAMHRAGKMPRGCCRRLRGLPNAEANHAYQKMLKLVQQVREVDSAIREAMHGAGGNGAGEKGSPAPHKAVAQCAYVTFESSEGALRAKREFTRNPLARCCLRQSIIRRGGDAALKTAAARGKSVAVMGSKYDFFAPACKGAPEPSDIVWENVNTSKFERRVRQAATSLITLALLLGVFLLIFVLEEEKRSTQRKFPSVQCDQFPDPGNVQAVVHDELLASPTYAAQFGNETQAGRLECFCKALLSNHSTNPLALQNYMFTLPFPEGVRHEALCWDWLETFLSVQGITYGVALLTLALNSATRPIISFLVNLEGRRSRGSRLQSSALKLFGFQVVNTGLIVLLVNSHFDDAVWVLGWGAHRDFEEDWYLSVGVAITITMLLMTVTPQLSVLARVFMRRFALCRDRGCTSNSSRTDTVTQVDFNKLFEGPSMAIDERYAQLLTTMFVALTYSTAIPLLLPIACTMISLTFLCDLVFFIHCYKRPPSFSFRLPLAMSQLLPLAALSHLLVGMWVLSNPSIFPPTDAVSKAVDTLASSNGSLPSSFSSLSSAASMGLTSLQAIGSDQFNLSERVATTAGFIMFFASILLVLGLVFKAFFFDVLVQLLTVLVRCCPQKVKLRRALPLYWQAIPASDVDGVIAEGKQSLLARGKGHLWEWYTKAHDFVHSRDRAPGSEDVHAALDSIALVEEHGDALVAQQDDARGEEARQTAYILAAKRQLLELEGAPTDEASEAERARLQRSLQGFKASVGALQNEIARIDEDLDALEEEYERLSSIIQDAGGLEAAQEQAAGASGPATMSGLISYEMEAHPEYAAVFGLSMSISDVKLLSLVQMGSGAAAHAAQQVALGEAARGAATSTRHVLLRANTARRAMTHSRSAKRLHLSGHVPGGAALAREVIPAWPSAHEAALAEAGQLAPADSQSQHYTHHRAQGRGAPERMLSVGPPRSQGLSSVTPDAGVIEEDLDGGICQLAQCDEADVSSEG